MKKIFIISILFIFLFFTFWFLLKNKFSISNTIENNIENIDTSQLYSYEYFNPISQEFYYGDTMKFRNGIYFLLIDNYQEYLNYINYYPDILKMQETEFDNFFMVLTVTENESTKNLGLESVIANETTFYIGLDKKTVDEEPNLDRGISIKINRTLLKENIDVYKTIKNTKFMNTYSDIKTLTKDYSIENAIKDNCFVISTNPAQNINLFENFLEKIKNNQDAEIRIVNKDSIKDSIIIYDLKYSSVENKYYACIDNSRIVYTNYDSSIALSDSYNYYEYDVFEKIDDSKNSEMLNIYILKNTFFEENTLAFGFCK